MAEQRRACASCGTANEEDARFCEGCGASFARTCATCGVEASASARFCRACGAPLDGQVAQPPDIPAAGPVRKTVTVMFADLAGSTTFEERVDAETAREVIGRYHDLLRITAERHRAGMTKYIGDGFMAVWGVPEIGPDDAAHAVDAAVELQERFVDLASQVTETHGVELDLRVAVNTGEVVVGAGDADLVGDALNVGARLESECPRGRVVVGEETWRATRGQYGYESLGEIQVKGRTAPVVVYQWLGRQSSTADATPFVGRSDEVRRLQAAIDDAVAARAARLVTVIGDPGVGKSRLAAEFTATQPDARLVDARCDLEGTVALAPLVEVLRATDLETDIPASVPERDRLLRDLNGLATGVAGSVEENFWALRRFIEVLATDGPVVLVLDDIQWADTLLLDFVEHLVEWAGEVPVLVLALARPELRELRPDLVTVSRWVSEAVHLSGLDPRATAELAAQVLGAARLPDELLRRLPSTTGGNPLFVRELIGMLAHDGVLVHEQAGWRLTIDVDAIAIPPTIHALLASRLERLDATDRRVLEIASVIGSDFSLGAVRALAGNVATGVALSLKRLRRLELTQPSGAYIGDEPVWRFHHVLIRDVAYRRLLKSDRADLHERLADWVTTGGPSVAFDSDEMIARHLESAHTYRVELGTLDEHTGDLALRAARHYSASARRALDRDELLSAGAQAARGAALAAADGAVHAELLLIGCEAFLSAGDVTAGAPLVDDLDRIADATLEPWATCYRCQFVIYTDPERLLEVEARLQGAIDEFGRRNDPAGLAKAHRVRAGARSRLGRIGDCEADLFEALIAARHSGDHRQITAALGAAPGAALWGPSPVPKAGGRCLDVVRMQRMTTAAPSLEATSLRCLAVLELLRGRPDKARTMLADARQVVADLGLRHGLMETELFAGIIESMEGDPVAAEPHFRTALEGLEALGVGADAGQAAALLARSELAQGRVDEADEHATLSERLAGRNLKTAIAWRAVRAEILAARGQHTDAAAMARDAVAVAAGTDLVIDHAEACLALSRVLSAAGDIKGANGARDDADRLCSAKEVATAMRRVAEPAPPPVTPPPDLTAKAPASSRLAVTNRSCEYLPSFIRALHAHDVDGTLRWFSDDFVYDDRRQLSGDPVVGRDAMRAAIERIFAQYTRFDIRVLAVRGQRSHLVWTRWSDDDGNETTTFYVNETGDDGRLTYHGRFDEDDFMGAYCEFESRYLAGEGVAIAEAGSVGMEWFIALNRGDMDRAFGELMAPGALGENRSRTAFPDPSVSDPATSFGDLNAMVGSTRTWPSALCSLSPNWFVSRLEREAVGRDGETYAWTWLTVSAVSEGRFVSSCFFDPEDEDAAFAYAEERMQATSRLEISNLASDSCDDLCRAMQYHDADGASRRYSETFAYDDHRRISGDAVVGLDAMRTGIELVCEQYPHLEWRTLAVRGERLELRWVRLWDDAGNETSSLMVLEVNHDGRIAYQGRFDEEDFDDAYRELEKRYYAGEGAAFAEAGATVTKFTLALNRVDFDTLFNEIIASDFRIENRSRSAFPDRSPSEYRTTLEELEAMVVSVRGWCSAICWVSPNYGVARCEREAVGEDGERYTWLFLVVFEARDGRVASMCEFELDDEDGAFAYAETRVRATTSRLGLTNQATRTAQAFWASMRDHDVDGALECCSDGIVYDDRRSISGDPIHDRSTLRAAISRILEQYTDFETRTLAVRGEHLHLGLSRWSNSAGFETTYLHVVETGAHGRFDYEARFDEDDFEDAYRELEKRYSAGEGGAFAEASATTTEYMVALNERNLDRLIGELTSADFCLHNRSRSPFGDRSAAEFRASVENLHAMVDWARSWESAVCWLSPTLAVSRYEREAVGLDGERFRWTHIIVNEIRNGRIESACLFDFDDEDAAFSYAEERVLATTSRLLIRNRASECVDVGWRAIRARDADAVADLYADRFEYDDRRQLRGDPIEDHAALRRAVGRIIQQYPHVEWRTLAVRGERLELHWSRWSDDAENEATYLHVCEIDDDGRISYDSRFEEDDFESAYRELDRRYYAGEGAAFAEEGTAMADLLTALTQDEHDGMIDNLTVPGLRIRNRSRSAFGDRSLAEFRASFKELNAMVASVRAWQSAACWLSPTLVVGRFEREAIGPDGERYAWTHLHVDEIRNGRLAAACLFELDDEEAAFAYAEECARASASRLALTNRASETVIALASAGRARDVDAMFGWYSDGFTYDDRRRLSGDPITTGAALRIAQARILKQYSRFDLRTLAVRGERLHLGWGRWSNDAGFETTHLYVHEVGDDGRIAYEGRFDEDDFEGAYRELDRRYYSGEGVAFAEAGATATNWVIGFNRSDFDWIFGELTSPEVRFENRSRSVFPDRSAAQFRESVEALDAMVASSRTWHAVMSWLSPVWVVVRQHREAVGRDGERYEWLTLHVSEVRDGRLQSICQFEIDDEEAAFAYAEERVRATASRLALTNRASQTADALGVASRNADVDGAVNCYAKTFVFDDRRRLTGDPISGVAELRAASQRIFEQYSQFSWRTLAVRGTCLHLAWSCWADDAGNETGYLHVREVGDDGRFTYDARFDEDDFDSAYRELEKRYYSGEGAAYAEPGALITQFTIAYNEGDFDKLFGDLTTPGMQFENRSRSVFPDRSVDEFRASVEELSSMVSSSRTWSSAICWMSTSCCVSRLEREAIGQEGERYSWTTIYVSEVRNGRVAAVRQFDLEDEESAIAYAEERVRATTSRLAITNRSCEFVLALNTAMQAHDIDDIMRRMSERLVYDDHRRLTGDPISGEAEFRAAFARILDQYSHFENRILAVRGEHLNLYWSRWSDASGNETSYLHVVEIDDDGLQIYEGRFDEDDFVGAYRELERRYLDGEGAEFAESVAASADWVTALIQGDFDRMLNQLSDSNLRIESRSRSAFPERSAADLRVSLDELGEMVTSVRTWNSAVCCVSPTWIVARMERDALGLDGERYEWTRIYVGEYRHGRMTSLCEFEIDDEDAAFAYAEARVRATASRLAVTNRSSESVHAMANALRANDIDAAFVHLSEGYEYDDRRRLSGDPIHGLAELRVAVERILAQYNRFEWRTLAVRGQRISLSSSRWSDDAGNETTHLHVFEIGEDGLIAYEGRFDEDDFASAYRELDRRYYAGEGAAFAEAGSLATDYALAMFNGDYDKLFGDLSHPDMRVKSRTRSGFPDRSLAELRSSIEDLDATVASARTWHSAVVWVSPTCCVGRHEREAVGHDGERFTWTRVLVFEVRDGRMASMCAFELDYEEAAFAYAEERVRATTSRLPVTNRATEVGYRVVGASQDRDFDAVVTAYSDQFTYVDRRRLSGDPVTTRAELRAAVERIGERYSRFEAQTLAVRGERLQLARTLWSDNAGNETTYLQVIELSADGRIDYHAAFDEDDFVDAYRELENRYFAGEGAAFAEAGAVTTDYMIAANRGDLDLLFGDLTAPGVYFENRSRSGFPDRSASEYQVGTTDLFATMDSVRLWNTATCWLSPTVIIGRQVREARGAEGELYAWDRLLVSEVLDGRIASACEFELEHEEAAFAYAEEQVRATAGRLAVINLASRVWNAVGRAMRAHNADGAAALFADQFVYDDRWAVGGDPPDEVRAAVERIFEQYSQFEGQTLGVRGDTLQLARSRWSNDAGYETTYLHVTEIDGDGRISYYGRFDDNDFEGAYRELDRRYYAGEGAAFAEAGAALTEWMTALNRGDLGRVFGELTDPDMRFEIRSSSAFPDRTAAELRASLEELNTWVASTQAWHSAMRWLSPNCCVSRNERTGVGRDGEQYAWTRLYVFEVRDGRGVASCEFEVDDEEAAFAYAEERMQATASRLAVSNRASRTSEAVLRAMQAHDTDGTAACYSEPLVFDDRRRLAGNPLPDLHTASERVFEQYTQFEGRMLAVRGERLALGWTRWSNESGFDTAYLVLHEIGDDGRFVYEGRLDEDDFEGAYRELQRRYCAGEGAAVAPGVTVSTEWVMAVNRSDFDRAFGELTDPEMRVENRSASAFPHRSAAELRASYEQLNALVASVRSWNSAECWLSSNVVVARHERQASGPDAEQYTWTRLYVLETVDGRCSGLCAFELDDETAAFVYAEERVRGAEQR